MSYTALKKEKKRLQRLAKLHHHRVEECSKLGCKNPYSPILESFQAELRARQPFTWRNYLYNSLAKLIKAWK